MVNKPKKLTIKKLPFLSTKGFKINLLIEYDLVTGEVIKNLSIPGNRANATFNKLNISGDYKSVASNYLVYREGFDDKARYDANHWRGGFGTENKVLTNGQVVKVTKGTTFTEEEAKRTLQYDIDKVFIPAIQKKISKADWEALKPTQQAALISYAYNTGNINDDMAKNIKSKNFTAVANALANGLATSNKKPVPALAVRRQEEAILFSK